MTPKKVDPPKMPISALDNKPPPQSDQTATAYSSLISTTPAGLTLKAKTAKKSLLGGV